MRHTVAIAGRVVKIYGLNAATARALIVRMERQEEILSATRGKKGAVRIKTIGRVTPTYKMVQEWIEALKKSGTRSNARQLAKLHSTSVEITA